MEAASSGSSTLREPASRTRAQHHAASHTFVLEVLLEALLEAALEVFARGRWACKAVRKAYVCACQFSSITMASRGSSQAAGIALVPPRGHIRQTRHGTPRHEAPVAISNVRLCLSNHTGMGGDPVCKESLVTAGAAATIWVSSSCVVVVVCRCESRPRSRKSQGWGPGSFDVISPWMDLICQCFCCGGAERGEKRG